MKGQDSVEKLKTGISGFDLVGYGGLPKGRTTLVAGSAGSGKTVFAAQFLVEGVAKADEAGVFVTFEESPQDICKNLSSLGWDVEALEKKKQWVFVDASPQVGEQTVEVGGYDLSALLSRIEVAVKDVDAKRISMDSLGAIFSRFKDRAVIRGELYRIAQALKSMGITCVMTAERNDEYGSISRTGVEEFVTDNVIILRNVLEDEKRRRTLEILKYRGTTHQKGEQPFTIIPDEGFVVIPLSAIQLKQKSTDLRVTSGNESLDSMCGGGFFRDSVTLISGATGTGKTLMCTEFIAGGVPTGDRCMLFAFEESREQLFRNASGWGVEYEPMEREGKLKVLCEYPEATSMEDRLVAMKKAIQEFKPHRVAVDSLSALERVSSLRGFREFIIGLTSFIKHQESTGLFTSTTSTLLGGASITEAHISTLTDSIILLRYVEMFGEMRRGLTVLKMRGSQHHKDIREFTIDNTGLHLGNPFSNVSGILAGNPTRITTSEIERIGDMFPEV